MGIGRHLAVGASAVICVGGSIMLWGLQSELTAATCGTTAAMSLLYAFGSLEGKIPQKRIGGQWHSPIVTPAAEPEASHTQRTIQQIYDAYRPLMDELKGKKEPEEMPEKIVLKGPAAEAEMIDRYLGITLGLPLALNYKKVIQTPLHFLYPIIPVRGKPYNIDLLTDQVLQQIEQQASRLRRKSANRQVRETSVVADVLRSQPPYLRLTNPQPSPNVLPAVDRAPFVTALGTVYEPKAQPVTLNLGGKDCAVSNGLFCGMPRMGKSRTIHAGLLGLLRSTPPENLHVYALETKTDAYRIYEGLPHMRAMVGKMEGVLPVLEQFQYWCTTEGRPTDGAVRLLIFDEFQLALADEEIGEQVLKLVKDIMSRGAEAGLRVWIATQVPDRESYPSNLKAKTHFVVVCKVKMDIYIRQVFGIRGATDLRPQLEFLYSGEGDLQKVAAFHLPDEVLTSEIAALRTQYGVVRTGTSTGTSTSTGTGTSGTGTGTGGGTGGTGVVRRTSPTGVHGRTSTGGTALVTRGSTLSHAVPVQNFPLVEIRPLTKEELEYVDEQIAEGNPALFHKGVVGLNKLTKFLYGALTPNRKKAAKNVLEALGRA